MKEVVIDASVATTSVVEESYRLMPRAFAISLAQSVTISDSLYVTLAEKLDVPMVTADQRLVRQMASDAALANRAVWVGDHAA